MKSKLGNIFKEISEYDQRQKETPTPEYIALQFMEWKKNKTGENVSYFIGGRRNNSKVWKYFEELSEELFKIQREGHVISLNEYFDERSRKACRNENLYPHQFLITERQKWKIKTIKHDGVLIVYSELDTYKEREETINFWLDIFSGYTIEDLFECLPELYPPAFVKEYYFRISLENKLYDHE